MVRELLLAGVLAGTGLGHADLSGAPAKTCRVSNAEMLPNDSGGAAALCAAIEKAAADHGLKFTVDVRVRSDHALSATVTLPDGRKLPAQELSVSDAKLSGRSFEWFAGALARSVEAAAN